MLKTVEDNDASPRGDCQLPGSMTRGVDIDDNDIKQHFKTEVIKKYNVEGIL